MTLFYPSFMLLANQSKWSNFDSSFYVSIHGDPIDGLPCQEFCLLYAHVVSCSSLVHCLAVLWIFFFFCLSLQYHLWLWSHLWITSMVLVLSVSQLWSMASHGVWAQTACLCAHHLVLIFFIVCCHAVWYIYTWLHYINENCNVIGFPCNNKDVVAYPTLLTA